MRIIVVLVLAAYALVGCAAREPEKTPAFEEILKIDLHMFNI